MAIYETVPAAPNVLHKVHTGSMAARSGNNSTAFADCYAIGNHVWPLGFKMLFLWDFIVCLLQLTFRLWQNRGKSFRPKRCQPTGPYQLHQNGRKVKKKGSLGALHKLFCIWRQAEKSPLCFLWRSFIYTSKPNVTWSAVAMVATCLLCWKCMFRLEHKVNNFQIMHV